MLINAYMVFVTEIIKFENYYKILYYCRVDIYAEAKVHQIPCS